MTFETAEDEETGVKVPYDDWILAQAPDADERRNLDRDLVNARDREVGRRRSGTPRVHEEGRLMPRIKIEGTEWGMSTDSQDPPRFAPWLSREWWYIANPDDIAECERTGRLVQDIPAPPQVALETLRLAVAMYRERIARGAR